MLEFIKIIRDNNIDRISDMEKYTTYTKTQLEGFFHQMQDMRLLIDFDMTKDHFRVNWENVGLWEKYTFSPNWYIYYKSDCIKEKYSKMGLNYDEMDDDME